MTNQEWLQQNNAKIEQLQEKLANKVVAKGTIDITENGKHNVAGYSDANVNVPVPDLSKTTATVEDVVQGKQFYNAQGELVDGNYIDIMNRYIAFKQTCYQLFQGFTDEDMSWTKNLDTTGIENTSYMFDGCKNATVINVSNFDTSQVTNITSMFSNCNNLLEIIGIENLDTSNLTSFYKLFFYCYSITSLDLSNWNISNVTNTGQMFRNCKKLTSLDLSNWNISNVTNTSQMFAGCSDLKTIIGTLDVINASSLSGMFGSCYALEDVTLKNIKSSITFIGCDKLTNKSLINTFKELWDLTGGTSQILTLTNANRTNIDNIYVKLIEATDEMRAEDPYIDNKKPCEVCESTDEGAMKLTEYLILKNWQMGY